MVRILIAIIAVVVGLIAGGITNSFIGWVNIQIFPMPEGMTFEDMLNEENKKALLDWLGSLPQTAFILVLVAHLSQAFVGGLVAALIAKRNMMCVAMVVGIISLIFGIMNIMMIPAPTWLWIEMPLYLAFAWLAANFVIKRRRNPSTMSEVKKSTSH